jgi:SAM-dependent methyltransferase
MDPFIWGVAIGGAEPSQNQVQVVGDELAFLRPGTRGASLPRPVRPGCDPGRGAPRSRSPCQTWTGTGMSSRRLGRSGRGVAPLQCCAVYGSRGWNHNLHYHRVILGAVPPGAARALDVGCGEGFLARDLARIVPDVVAIDRHGPSIDRARAHSPPGGVEYVLGDFLSHELPIGSFDVVASVAVLHHMDMEEALVRMRDLLRPGGALVAVGMARSHRPADYMVDAAGAVVHMRYKLTTEHVEQTSPIVWPPPLGYRQVRQLAGRVLPGARYRRHLIWRYSLVWTKPAVSM